MKNNENQSKGKFMNPTEEVLNENTKKHDVCDVLENRKNIQQKIKQSKPMIEVLDELLDKEIIKPVFHSTSIQKKFDLDTFNAFVLKPYTREESMDIMKNGIK